MTTASRSPTTGEAIMAGRAQRGGGGVMSAPVRVEDGPGELRRQALDRIAELAHPDDYRELADGEAGGELGDAVAQRLPQDSGRVEILVCSATSASP